mgnify:CR=1 FL=1
MIGGLWEETARPFSVTTPLKLGQGPGTSVLPLWRASGPKLNLVARNVPRGTVCRDERSSPTRRPAKTSKGPQPPARSSRPLGRCPSFDSGGTPGAHTISTTPGMVPQLRFGRPLGRPHNRHVPAGFLRSKRITDATGKALPFRATGKVTAKRVRFGPSFGPFPRGRSQLAGVLAATLAIGMDVDHHDWGCTPNCQGVWRETCATIGG